MQRLRGSGSSVLRDLSVLRFKRKAQNSWAAVQDTYFSTKNLFERHRVVFTIGTSIASVATACIGYSLRHLHEQRVNRRLESIEKALKNNHGIEHSEIKTIVDSGRLSLPAFIATAGTTLIVGYGLGWRGGRLYAHRQLKREQTKFLGQIKQKVQVLEKMKPRRWQFQFLRKDTGTNI